MKKCLKAVLAAVLLFAAAGFAVHFWIDTGTAAEQAVCIYAQGAAGAMDYARATEALQTAGIDTAVEADQKDVLARAQARLKAGATVLILGLDAAPADDSLLRQAEACQAELFFVGTYPGSAYLNQYDKAYYIGSHAEYGGELAGHTAAMLYRSGAITDLTGNALLDYLSAGVETDTQKTLLQYTLQECEHYGVYSESSLTPHAEDSSDASSDAGTSLEQVLGLAGSTGSAGSTAADSSAVSTAPGSASLGENAAALGAQWADLEFEPEIIYCFGADSLRAAEEYAAALGWSSRPSPVQFMCFTGSLAEAQQAADGVCGSVLYYDADAVTDDVVQMVLNQTQQNYIAESTGLTLDENNALWIPYQLYRTAENDPVPAQDVPADSTGSSAASAQG